MRFFDDKTIFHALLPPDPGHIYQCMVTPIIHVEFHSVFETDEDERDEGESEGEAETPDATSFSTRDIPGRTSSLRSCPSTTRIVHHVSARHTSLLLLLVSFPSSLIHCIFKPMELL